MCWYFLTNAEESISVRNYCCSLHLEVFRASYFPQRMEVISSSLFVQGQPKGRDRKWRRDRSLYLLGLKDSDTLLLLVYFEH
jgi:hypothetical protein